MDSRHEHHGSQEANHYNGEPSAALIEHVKSMTPGRAVDLGCGTGADAIWLASHGWKVTAVDISRAAIDRAVEAARASGVTVKWVCGDFVDQPVPERSFDLVTAFYPALLKTDGDDAVESLTGGVAEGGTLLVVGHSPEARETVQTQGFDPSRYMEPPDIAARLDPTGWEIRISTGEDLRTEPSEPSSSSSHDVILKARRR